jgi:hypothetical protein
VLAVDAGSNQVSMLRVDRDGKLSLVPGGVGAEARTSPFCDNMWPSVRSAPGVAFVWV